MTDVMLNTDNFIKDTDDYYKKSSDVTVREIGANKYNEPNNVIIAFPKGLVDDLKAYYETRRFEDEEFEDGEGELIDYANRAYEVDAILRHILYVSKSRVDYTVTVAFNVEARSAEEAENLVTEELPWGLDYNLLTVEED